MAVSSVDIGITATPSLTTGIINFTITYVSDTQLDLDWGFSGDAVNIMIRAQYGAYPDDIPNEDTAPTDGYLVYYGGDTSASDTSMNFDESPGVLYYKAWGQKADGKWYVNTSTDSEESRQMTLIALFIFSGILTFIAVRSSYWILKVLAGLVWFAIDSYWVTNPPSSITIGSSTHVIIMFLLGAIGIALAFMPFWYTRNENGNEVAKGFRRFLAGVSKEEEESERYKPTRRERNSAYRDKINDAIEGRVRRR